MSDLVEPLLSRFAVARTGNADLPGRYDEIRQVWVVDTDNGARPLIESEIHQKDTAELATKTDVRAERDDPGTNALLDLSTKTRQQTERDDIQPRDPLLALITVTKIGSERPDI